MSILDHPNHPCESTGSGETHGYIVEMRSKYETTKIHLIGEQRVTSEWKALRPVRVSKGSGVPNGHGTAALALEMAELLDYPTAESLRWTAVARAKEQYLDLETRLVRHELSWSWRSKPIEAVKTVGQSDLMWPYVEPKPKEVALSDLDLFNIIEQRKFEHLKKQEYDKGAQWREVQRALMTAADINDATPTEQ
jgi:hypothetical protein